MPTLPRFSLLLFSTSLLAATGCTQPADEPAAPIVTDDERGIDGAWLIQLEAATPPDDVAAIADELLAGTGARVRYVYEAAVVGFAAEGLAGEHVAAIARDPRVAHVEQDRLLDVPELDGIDITPAADAQQSTTDASLDRVDQRDLPGSCSYRYQPTGMGVDVYVLDSGVRVTHSEFEGRATALYDAVANVNGVATDTNGHGTAVASLISGRTYGVAKGARILAVKVYNVSGPMGDATVGSFVRGVDFVTNRVKTQRANGNFRPAVANLSIGLQRNTAGQDMFTTAINNMSVAGIQPVAADSEDAGTTCEAQAFAGGAITVGGTDPRNDRRLAGGSPCVDMYAPTGARAAGNDSDFGVFIGDFGGTSGAAPRVSGIAALHLQQFPTATVSAPNFCPLTGTPPSSSVTCSVIGHATRDKLVEVPVGDRTNRLAYSRLAVDPTVTISRNALAYTVPLGAISTAQTVNVGVLSGLEAAEYRIETSGQCWLSVTPAPNPLLAQSCGPNYLTSQQPTISVSIDARRGRGCIEAPGEYAGPINPAKVRVIGTNGVVREINVTMTVN